MDPSNALSAEDIVRHLRDTHAQLNEWFDAALDQYRDGHEDSFVEIVRAAASGPAAQSVQGEEKQTMINMLNAVAAHFIKQATEAADTRSADRLLGRVVDYINKADRLDPQMRATWVTKGYHALAQRKRAGVDVSTYSLVEAAARDGDPRYVVASLHAQGMLLFRQSKFEKALGKFKEALRVHPDCSAESRLGLAHCYYKMGETALARKAFERVVERDPNNVEGLVGLAIFHLNDAANAATAPETPTSPRSPTSPRAAPVDRVATVQKAMKLFAKAYQAQPTHPMVLNHLANHFLYRKDWDKVTALARKARSLSTSREVRGESAYILARAAHAQGDFKEARRYYAESTKVKHSSTTLAHYGMGQVLLESGADLRKVKAAFEQVRKHHPDNYETLKALAHVHSRMGTSRDTATAIKYFRRVTELHPEDVQVWLELGKLLESANEEAALRAYQSAERVLLTRDEPVSGELKNNIGVLLFRQGDGAQALGYFKAALPLFSNDYAAPFVDPMDASFTIPPSGPQVTIYYNIAQVYEMMYDEERALRTYTALVAAHPAYVEAYLRLGRMEERKGKVWKSSDHDKKCAQYYYEEGVAVLDTGGDGAVDAQLMLGNLYMAEKDFKRAQDAYDRALRSGGNDDAYARVALGNLFATSARSYKKKPARFQKYVKSALDLFVKVLKRDENNVFAANGIGMVLALQDRNVEARNLFSKVRDTAADDCPEALVNLAHMMCRLDNYEHAIKLYENVLFKLRGGKDVRLLTFLARAYHESGQPSQALQMLSRALHIQPAGPDAKRTMFNIAVVEKESAMATLKAGALLPADALRAVQGLTRAFGTLTSLARSPAAATTLPNAPALASQCKGLLRNAKALLEKVRREHIAKAHEMEEAKKDMAARRREKEERLRREKEEVERKRQEEKKRAAEKAERLRQLQASWAESKEKETKKGGRKRKKNNKKDEAAAVEEEEEEEVVVSGGTTAAADDDSDEDDVDFAPTRSKKRRRVSESDDEFSSDDDEDEEDEKKKKAEAEAEAAASAEPEQDGAGAAATGGDAADAEMAEAPEEAAPAVAEEEEEAVDITNDEQCMRAFRRYFTTEPDEDKHTVNLALTYLGGRVGMTLDEIRADKKRRKHLKRLVEQVFSSL